MNAATRYADHTRAVENIVIRSNVAFWRANRRSDHPIPAPLLVWDMVAALTGAVEATSRRAS